MRNMSLIISPLKQFFNMLRIIKAVQLQALGFWISLTCIFRNNEVFYMKASFCCSESYFPLITAELTKI